LAHGGPSGAGLGNCTLKGGYLPSRDREGAVTLPNSASPSKACLPELSVLELYDDHVYRRIQYILFLVPCWSAPTYLSRLMLTLLHLAIRRGQLAVLFGEIHHNAIQHMLVLRNRLVRREFH